MDSVKKALSGIFMYGVIVFTIIVSIFPIIWVIMSSFKTNGEIMSGPFVFPSSVNFNAYVYLFENYNFLTYTINSLLVSFLPTLLSLLFFSMGAYVIAKYDFKGKNLFFALFVITLLVPPHARTQPIFSLIVNLNLYNTKTGLAIVYLSSGLAMSMFILKNTFQSIPNELNQAAHLDGAGFVRTFITVNLPLARTGMVTAGVLMFLANWNEFYYANLLISSSVNRTLPVTTILFNSMFSYNYTNTFAALVVVVIPGIIFYALAQRQVQNSMMSSSLKG